MFIVTSLLDAASALMACIVLKPMRRAHMQQSAPKEGVAGDFAVASY